MIDRTIHIPEVKAEQLDEIEEFLNHSLVGKYDIIFEHEMRDDIMLIRRDVFVSKISHHETHRLSTHLAQQRIDHNITYTHTF